MAQTTLESYGLEDDIQLVEALIPWVSSRLAYLDNAKRRPVRSHNGDTLQFTRRQTIDPIIGEIDAYSEPAPSQLQAQNKQTKIVVRGGSVEIESKAELFNPRSLLAHGISALSEALAQGQQTLIHGKLQSGSSFKSASSGTNSDIPTELVSSDFDDIFQMHEVANGQAAFEPVPASDAVSTSAVEYAYVFITHALLISTITRITGFLPGARYGTSGMRFGAGEIGAIGYSRVETQTNSPVLEGVSQDGRDIILSFSIGAETYSEVDSDSSTTQVNILDRHAFSYYGKRMPISLVYLSGETIEREENLIVVESTQAA